MIELKNMNFSYGENPILQEVSLSFAPGKFYGILGPNGRGKTTLIRLLCGLLTPDGGEVLLDGRPKGAYAPREWAKKISLMPQFRSLPPVSGEELVLRGRYPYWGTFGRPCKADRDAVAAALKRAEAEYLAHRNVTELSGGERQKICLAMLLAQDTPYVLLDEPTAFLDPAHRFALSELLKDLRAEGKCVIAVLHDLSMALRDCDSVAVLENGRVRSFDTPEKTVADGILDEVFSLRCRAVPTEEGTEYLFLPKKRASDF